MATALDKLETILHQKKCERKWLIAKNGDKEEIENLNNEIKELEKRITSVKNNKFKF